MENVEISGRLRQLCLKYRVWGAWACTSHQREWPLIKLCRHRHTAFSYL